MTLIGLLKNLASQREADAAKKSPKHGPLIVSVVVSEGILVDIVL